MILKCKTLLLFLITSVLFFKAETASASHAAGGELSYEWLRDSTYTIYFKFYKDCSGVPETNVVTLCYQNTCNSFFNSIDLNKMTTLPGGVVNGSPVSVGCSSYPTKCDNVSSTLPGYREWWYSGQVTLNSRCNNWVFGVTIQARNLSENLPYILTTPLYIEARLNNVDAQGNSSPFFSVKPVPYVCNGQKYTYNNGATDKDNDSLSFEMINPLESTNCIIGSPIPYNSPNLNNTNNPFETTNTFTLDPATGQISFTPASLGAQTITIKVSEYRHQKLIGSVIRDIQVQSLSCNAAQPSTEIDGQSLSSDTVVNSTIQACAGVSMRFCFSTKSADTDAVLLVSDNHSLVIPAAGVSYSSQKTDSIRGCFNWTPSSADVGLKIFTVTVKDSTCKPPGISVSQTFSYPINVRAAINYASDTAICLGDTVSVHAFYGSIFKWSVLYGGPDLFSCGTCYSTKVWPPVNTGYLVKTNENAFCSRNIDTVRVKIKTEIPDIPAATSNTPVCYGDTIRLYGSTVIDGGYIWTGPEGFKDTIQNPVIPNVTFDNGGRYFIQAYSYISQCPSKVNFTEVEIAPIPYAFFQYPENICVGQQAQIRPDRDYNSVYLWNFAGANTVDTSKLNIHYLSWNDSGIKKVILRLRGQNGCYSIRDTGIINVHDKPEASIILVSKNNICSNDTIAFAAAEHDIYSYKWSPEQYFANSTSPSSNATIAQSGYVYLTVTDPWACTNADSIFVTTYPCCDAFLPNAFTPNGDGKNDLFRVITIGHHQLSKFLITNRWGQTVFDTRDEHEGWDGTFHGTNVDAGSYFYYLRYKCSDDKIVEKKGEITLVR